MTELKTTREQWEDEISYYHPTITHFPKERWPTVVRFFGWLPFWVEDGRIQG